MKKIITNIITILTLSIAVKAQDTAQIAKCKNILINSYNIADAVVICKNKNNKHGICAIDKAFAKSGHKSYYTSHAFDLLKTIKGQLTDKQVKIITEGGIVEGVGGSDVTTDYLDNSWASCHNNMESMCMYFLKKSNIVNLIDSTEKDYYVSYNSIVFSSDDYNKSAATFCSVNFNSLDEIMNLISNSSGINNSTIKKKVQTENAPQNEIIKEISQAQKQQNNITNALQSQSISDNSSCTKPFFSEFINGAAISKVSKCKV